MISPGLLTHVTWAIWYTNHQCALKLWGQKGKKKEERKALICCVHSFPWCQYSQYGSFQATPEMSLNLELGRGPHVLVSSSLALIRNPLPTQSPATWRVGLPSPFRKAQVPYIPSPRPRAPRAWAYGVSEVNQMPLPGTWHLRVAIDGRGAR